MLLRRHFRVLCLLPEAEGCREVPFYVSRGPSRPSRTSGSQQGLCREPGGQKQMLYEQLEAICELKGWKKMPTSYQKRQRQGTSGFLMEDEGMKNAHFLVVANGTREYKNKVMCKRRRDTTSLQVMEMIQGDEHTFDCWVTYKAPNREHQFLIRSENWSAGSTPEAA